MALLPALSDTKGGKGLKHSVPHRRLPEVHLLSELQALFKPKAQEICLHCGTEPKQQRSTGSLFAVSSLTTAAEKSPTTLPGCSFALKFGMLMMFRTNRVLKTPVLPLPKPCREVWLPQQAQSCAWLALLWLWRGRLPSQAPDQASGIPILEAEAAA